MLDTSVTPPPVWGLPLSITPPFIHWLPYASECFGDICMSYGDFIPYVWGLGVFSHLLGVLGASAHGMTICSFLYILYFVMSNVSTMAMTTTTPVMVVSSGLSSVSSVLWPLP